MAQNRSQQPKSPGPGSIAFKPGVVLRVGRPARERLGHPANDNRATLTRRLATLLIRVAIAGAAVYAVWQVLG